MKIYLLRLSLLVFLLMPSLLMAQDQKIGFFDSDYVLQNIPEYIGIEQQLKIVSDRWREEIKVLEDEITALEADFEAKEILYTDEIRQQRLQEIEQKKRAKDALINRRFGPDGEYFRQQEQLLEPIQRQIITAVQTVASRNAYDMIFDTAKDLRLVYARNEWNISNEILIELGIEVDEESN